MRGGSSELVHEAHVRGFLDLVPHAEYRRRRGAPHGGGDSNDHFSDAVLDFVGKDDGGTSVASPKFAVPQKSGGDFGIARDTGQS